MLRLVIIVLMLLVVLALAGVETDVGLMDTIIEAVPIDWLREMVG